VLESESVDGVLIDDIETENVVQLGPELVALKAWEKLDMSSILEGLGMNAPAIATAQLMVANRLIEPLSEWALIDWSSRTALPELQNMRITKASKDRLYRVSDQLIGHQKHIEKELKESKKGPFSAFERSIVLYDVPILIS